MDGIVIGHAAGGTALVCLGLAATLAPKRRIGSPHRRIGQVYVAVLVVVLSSGMVIGAREPALTIFEIVTPPTLLAGLMGWSAARRPLRRRLGRRWKQWHLTGLGSSYIGVCTATAFQVVPRFAGTGPVTTTLLWLVPTVVGSVLIGRATARHTRSAPARHPAPAEA